MVNEAQAEMSTCAKSYTNPASRDRKEQRARVTKPVVAGRTPSCLQWFCVWLCLIWWFEAYWEIL